MPNTWYEKKERNLNSAIWIQNELKLNNIVELYKVLSESKNCEDIRAIFEYIIERDNIDLTSRKKEIMHIALNQVKNARIFPKLKTAIEWNDDDKEDLLKLASDTKNLKVLPRNIDWKDKTEEILNILKNGADFDGLDEGIINLEDNKERILEIAKERIKSLTTNLIEKDNILKSIFFSGDIPKSINWNDKKDDILEMIGNRDLLFRRLPTEGINWNDKKLEILKIAMERKNLDILSELNVTWEKDEKEKILDILEYAESLYEVSTINIEWNDPKDEEYSKNIKERLFEIAKRRGYFSWLPTKDIDWTDKKDEMLSIIENRKYNLSVLPQTGITWEEKDKERILNIAENQESSNGLEIEGIVWNADEKKRILKIAENQGSFLSFPTKGIDWNDKKTEILRIAEKNGFAYFPIKGIDWNDKKDEILEIKKRNGDFVHFPIEGIDWDDKKYKILNISEKIGVYLGFDLTKIEWDLNDISKLLKLKYPSIYYNRYINELDKRNPIINDHLLSKMRFEIGPFIRGDVASTTECQKDLLIDVIQNLDKVGNNIQYGVNNENEHLKGWGTKFRVDESKVIDGINTIDQDAPEISIFLAFYLNKLTKLHEEAIYYKALNGFEINPEYDEILKRTPESRKSTLSAEIQDYEQRRNNAYEKANNIISACKKLNGDTDKIGTNDYAVLKNQMEFGEKKNFEDFLRDYWIKKRNSKDGKLPNSNNRKMNDFINLFNEEIEKLLAKDYKVDEIEEIFLYTARNLEIVESAYRIKDKLIRQMIEHAERGSISIRYKEDTESQNEGRIHYGIVYAYSDKILLPVAFHVNPNEINSDGRLLSVDESVVPFSLERNILYPIAEGEKNKYFPKQTKTYSQLEEIYSQAKNLLKRYERILTRMQRKVERRFCQRNIDEFNNFVKDVARITLDENIGNAFFISQEKYLESNIEIYNKFQEYYDRNENNRAYNPHFDLATICLAMMHIPKTLERANEKEKMNEREIRNRINKSRENIEKYTPNIFYVCNMSTFFEGTIQNRDDSTQIDSTQTMPEQSEKDEVNISQEDKNSTSTNSLEEMFEKIKNIPNMTEEMSLQVMQIFANEMKKSFITDGITTKDINDTEKDIISKIEKDSVVENKEEQK